MKTLLAIESSCDETAAAIIQKNDNSVSILSSVTATSLAKHIETKGIVPEVAAREQLKMIMPVIERTFQDSQKSPKEIDALAITVGPGLVGSLLVGIETAKTLAYAWNLPIIPVNHVQAHPYANFVHTTKNAKTPQFPILSWVISGGHTDLYLMRSHKDIEKLGGTVDDAAGECFDKCARVLGFDYPGGPYIEKLADQKSAFTLPIKLPRPLMYEKTFNMSFSGLKTAFLRSFKENQSKPDIDQLNSVLATELQEAVSDIFVKRTQQAFEKHPDITSVIISGGVAANSRIRERLSKECEKEDKKFFSPPLSLCTDNAVMIGTYAAFHNELQTEWKNITLQLH